MLYAYGIDNAGGFPTGENNSNEAFRKIFQSKYVDASGEQYFGKKDSPWHKYLEPGVERSDTPGIDHKGIASRKDASSTAHQRSLRSLPGSNSDSEEPGVSLLSTPGYNPWLQPVIPAGIGIQAF